MEHVEVPSGIQRNPIVGQHELAPLQLGKSLERDDRHVTQAKLPGRSQATMAGDDVAVLADQNRICEAERADAAGDLGDLRIAVGARIAGEGMSRSTGQNSRRKRSGRSDAEPVRLLLLMSRPRTVPATPPP